MANKNQSRGTEKKPIPKPNEPKEKQWVDPKERSEQKNMTDRQKTKSAR